MGVLGCASGGLSCEAQQQGYVHPMVSRSLLVHCEINMLCERALDLACITEILLDYAAGPLLAQLSPAGTQQKRTVRPEGASVLGFL